MAELSEKMTTLLKERESVLAGHAELAKRLRDVNDLEVKRPGGKEAKTQALNELQAKMDQASLKISSLDEEFEIAMVEHASGLALLSSSDQK
jgi:hypothetical protein